MEIQAPPGSARQGLAADFEQHPPVFRFRHWEHSFYGRDWSFYFNLFFQFCIGVWKKFLCFVQKTASFGNVQNLPHAPLRLDAGKHQLVTTASTAQLEVHPHAQHSPTPAAAWMRLFQFQSIAYPDVHIAGPLSIFHSYYNREDGLLSTEAGRRQKIPSPSLFSAYSSDFHPFPPHIVSHPGKKPRAAERI